MEVWRRPPEGCDQRDESLRLAIRFVRTLQNPLTLDSTLSQKRRACFVTRPPARSTA